MPRVKPLTSEERQSRKLAGLIKKYMEINGVKTESELGRFIGRSGPTACHRMRKPEALQFGEMCHLFRALHVPNYEIADLFREERKAGEGHV